MKKKPLSVLLLSMLFFVIIANGVVTSTKNTSEAPLLTARVYIDPVNGTASVGALYTISVKVANVTNLYAVVFQIRWGTAVLQYVSHETKAGELGGVLNTPVATWKDVVDETANIPDSALGTTYWFAANSYGFAPTFNGSGTAFTMTFLVLRDGECDIYFTYTQLGDNSSPSELIPHTVEDAYFYRPGLGEVPEADFTLFPDRPIVNKTTAFNASDSHDPDAGVGGISLYIWNFKDGTPITNTTSPTINHTFSKEILYASYHYVELTVLDNQSGGSQSKPAYKHVAVVHPRPVAQFTVWPEDLIAVVNQPAEFNASESYDPDPGGSIVEYRWNFGDGNSTNATSPFITHKFQTTSESGFQVRLRVLDDTDGLLSLENSTFVKVVQERDIEVANVTASPDDVRQGEDVAIDVTIANKGYAEESFNINAYYNATTGWIPVDETSVSNFTVPTTLLERKLEFLIKESLNNTKYHILLQSYPGGSSVRLDTQVIVGTGTGYWTINPGLKNTAASSPTLVPGTPLSTGGWLYEEDPGGPKKLNGEFAAGDWAFKITLYANQTGVKATVLVRILKSNNPDPQAPGALVTMMKNWTSVFTAAELPNGTATVFPGNVPVPLTVFTDEYLFLELQLRVTENTAGGPAKVIFQIGDPFETGKAQFTTTRFSYRNKYTLSWRTEFVQPGDYVVKINTTQVPHETDTANNIGYSDTVHVTQLSTAVPPLDLSLDVGTIHFRGEIAEFYILVTSSGRRVDASLNASILFSRTIKQLESTDIERVDTGLYSVSYQIPNNASTGTYALVVDASRLIPELNFTQRGSALKSFLVSPTFTEWNNLFIGWNATLVTIQDDIATLMTAIGEIKANLTAINATLSGLIIGAKEEVLAQIDTALGPVIARLDTINATITSIEGDTMTISSDVGEVDASLGTLQSTITVGLAVASVFSAVAAILAILIFLRLRKLSK